MPGPKVLSTSGSKGNVGVPEPKVLSSLSTYGFSDRGGMINPLFIGTLRERPMASKRTLVQTVNLYLYLKSISVFTLIGVGVWTVVISAEQS